MPILNKLRTALPGGLGGDPARGSPRSRLTRLRTTLTVFFALDGFLFAGWVVRIPAVKEQTGASASDLGLALLGVSAGAVVTMMFTGRMCKRFGSHPVTVVSSVLLALSIALPARTHSVPALGLVLLVFGAAYGGLNVSMNSGAVDLVTALGRPVMSSFHAAFSLGGMAGAGLGGLVAGDLSASTHLLALTAVGLVVTALAAPSLLRHRHVAPPAAAPARDGAKAPRRTDRRTRRLVVLLGLIALCTAYGEGALADWGALHLAQDLDAGAGLAAAGYSLFALAMTVGRLSGTALIERLGQTRTLVAGGLVAALGMLLGALAPTIWLALLGFAVTGLGLANIFPVAVARAGALAGPSGVAAASTLGYGGMLLGPPAIGFLADWFSLPVALTTVALLAAAAALVAYGARAVPAPGPVPADRADLPAGVPADLPADVSAGQARAGVVADAPAARTAHQEG
ncbi:MFS transporter [Streptomyces sp. NBC_01498]|uniref:MFS transporter n=1 Tax=Streptomyces sp. NBC_01498 TaxID=2975870 RepID=UPI002E7AB4FE|nr:MFS transporter [Streptomyces sp. NBC_01498]WTL28240.1 MFS transporter [Streptomyces sp. NBC_01498]